MVSPIYDTLLQKRNSLALSVAQSGSSQKEQERSSHQVVGTSLRYNQRHSICLKYIPSLVVDGVHIHESQYPFS